MPRTEQEVDMHGFSFELDLNIQQSMREASRIPNESRKPVIDFDELGSCEEADDERSITKRKKRLKELRRAYKGRSKIK